MTSIFSNKMSISKEKRMKSLGWITLKELYEMQKNKKTASKSNDKKKCTKGECDWKK